MPGMNPASALIPKLNRFGKRRSVMNWNNRDDRDFVVKIVAMVVAFLAVAVIIFSGGG